VGSSAQAARADALLSLEDGQKKALVAYARLRARGTVFEFNDLLQGAYARWLSSDVPVSTPEGTFDYLRGAIRNTVSNEFRRIGTERRLFGEREFAVDGQQDPIENSPDPAGTQEDERMLAQLYELFAADPDIQSLLILQGAERAEILAELGWDVTKYETVQKRKKRMMARLINEGKI
jgi:DNA-directed RNA polymerase specialized sigma24 family protein